MYKKLFNGWRSFAHSSESLDLLVSTGDGAELAGPRLFFLPPLSGRGSASASTVCSGIEPRRQAENLLLCIA